MSLIKKIKKNLRNQTVIKMAEVISNFLSGLLSTAKDDFQRKSFLNCACTAWNISLFPDDKIQSQLDISVKDYERLNPDSCDSGNNRHNLEQLILLKKELYPSVKRGVIDASVEDKGDGEKITVLSVPFQG